MLDAIDEIRSFTQDMTFEQFRDDARTMKAALANLTIIGEAARHVPEDVAEKHPEVPWRLMRDMRNFVVHVYFSVEPSILWETIQRDLPHLESALRDMIGEE